MLPLLNALTTSDESTSSAGTGGRGGAMASPSIWLALLFVMGLALPFVPVPSPLAQFIDTIVLITVYTIVTLLMVVSFIRLRLSYGTVVLWFIAAVAIWALLDFKAMPAVGRHTALAARAAGGLPPLGVLVPYAVVSSLHAIALPVAAALGGMLLSRLISEASMVAPICVLIALIDIWGVLFGGIVSQLQAHAPNVAARAMAGAPRMGALTHSQFSINPPVIGAGDYLFLGMLFAALVTHNMNWRGALRWVAPLMVLALLSIPLSMVFGADIELPGLLFIGAGVAVPNRPFFKFTADEKVALRWAGGFVACLTVGLYFAEPYIVRAAQAMDAQPQPSMRVRPAPSGTIGRH